MSKKRFVIIYAILLTLVFGGQIYYSRSTMVYNQLALKHLELARQDLCAEFPGIFEGARQVTVTPDHSSFTIAFWGVGQIDENDLSEFSDRLKMTHEIETYYEIREIDSELAKEIEEWGHVYDPKNSRIYKIVFWTDRRFQSLWDKFSSNSDIVY